MLHFRLPDSLPESGRYGWDKLTPQGIAVTSRRFGARVNPPTGAVFLSYASEDSEAAQRIADALKAAGIEVWFDKSELRGGDAWDRRIRKQIRDCALFIPIISAHSQARLEGYFRREWKLAADRTHDMASEKAFLVPVLIDGTPERGASVPDEFRDVHWTHVPEGEIPPELVARIAHLLSPECGESLGSSGRALEGASTRDLSVRHNSETLAKLAAAQGQRGPSSPTREHQPPRSVAVLPFTNLSSDREQEYFSDGLTEELITQLAHVKGLRVLARTSSFAFKGKSEDLRIIGQRLAVGCIVEGSVRKAGNRLRITAQLISCSDGYHLWSETFDRELDDVFAIQNDISRSVANALGIVLGVSNAIPLGGTRNLEAYDLYLRARALHRLFGLGDIRRATELYRRALALDPEFALAWAGLAAELFYAFIYSPETFEGYPEFKHAVERALATAPNLWAGHAAHAFHEAYQRNWSAAESAYRQALELAPQSEPAVRAGLGHLLAGLGRAEEAISLLRSASAADPLSVAVSQILQITLTIAGRYEEADTEYRRSQDLSGNREGAEDGALRRAWARGLPWDAIKEQMRQFLTYEVVRMPVQSELLELIEQPAVARTRLRQAFGDATYQDPTRQFRIALWAAQFDDIDLALSAARRAYVDLRSSTTFLIWLPTYRKVRQDPRFKDLLRDLKIADYWRETGKWGDFARPAGAEDFEVW